MTWFQSVVICFHIVRGEGCDLGCHPHDSNVSCFQFIIARVMLGLGVQKKIMRDEEKNHDAEYRWTRLLVAPTNVHFPRPLSNVLEFKTCQSESLVLQAALAC